MCTLDDPIHASVVTRDEDLLVNPELYLISVEIIKKLRTLYPFKFPLAVTTVH